jgi:two-component system, NtrC family, response regulator HydG
MSKREIETPTTESIAYLVLREGAKWSESHELRPGKTLSIGRSVTNDVVLPHRLCSRNHCEIFFNDDRWMIRDLGSRNGTYLDGLKLVGDQKLKPGILIEIGDFDLAFVTDLNDEVVPFSRIADSERDTDPALAYVYQPESDEQPRIVHRLRESRLQRDGAARDSRDLSNSYLFTSLYQLAMNMTAAKSVDELSALVLEGLLASTAGDLGAVLLVPFGIESPQPADLRVTAHRSLGDGAFEGVSRYLTENVFSSGEALLAEDVNSHQILVERDSLGKLKANSVICAPITSPDRVHGLIHLYSSDPGNPLGEEELDFTLALARQMARQLDTLGDRESLAAGLEDVRIENDNLRQQLSLTGQIIGKSEPTRRLCEQIEQVSTTDAVVLVRGESGVGKELVARALHERSNRSSRPFVTMNCAALTETLLESELFGHERGSFTGAIGQKIGKFEQADTGTLFLDEVGEMGASIQAKFLRVLEGHPFERVGGHKEVRVDVRLIAATNRNLEEAVKAGTFRKDLYFRLHVVQIDVPPLRERLEDVPLLAEFFLSRYTLQTGRPSHSFSPSAMRRLIDYQWPGNIRELQNTIERAVILGRGEVIDEQDIQFSTLEPPRDGALPPAPSELPGNISLEELEQKHILRVLDETGWNKSQAAQILGIERSTLDRKLKKYKVQRPER